MKKLALLVPFLNTDYCMEIVTGVAEYFKDKPVKLVIAKTELPKNNTGLYDYQNWNLTELIRSEEFDAYIVGSALYCNNMPKEALEAFLLTLNNRPIISIGAKLDVPNVYTVTTDCAEAYEKIITHLKDKHGCKKIAFMSANAAKSEEAIDRYNGFKKALAKNNLEFYKNLVFEGNFTDFSAKESLSKVIKSKIDINFDAIVAANDMMALGSIEYLHSIGVNVPKDVKVIGFDNSDVAFLSRPKLSTINQDVISLGHKVGSVALSILEGKKTNRKNTVLMDIIYRQSCGCINCKTMKNVFIDGDEVRHDEPQNKINILSNYMSDLEEKNNIITLMDMVKSSNTIRQFFYNFEFIVPQANFDEMAVNLYDDPVSVEKDNVILLPKEMGLTMYADSEHKNKVFKPGTRFNPKKSIFSTEEYADRPGIYMIYPVFSAETNYGFVVAKTRDTKFHTYNVYLKIIGTAIAQACEYTRTITLNEHLLTLNSALQLNNDSLIIRSRTDELTGILNRHGFLEEGQRALDILQESGKPGIVFFADMDNLKHINDTYGHEMGDKAIKLQAKALKKAFRSTDVVGRLSGDEFGIIAVGVGIEYLELIRSKVDQINKQIAKEENLDFDLSISIGGVDLEGSSVLSILLGLADKELYIQKRTKKGLPPLDG